MLPNGNRWPGQRISITWNNSFAPSTQATGQFKSIAAQRIICWNETALKPVRYLFYAYRNRSGVIEVQIKKSKYLLPGIQYGLRSISAASQIRGKITSSIWTYWSRIPTRVKSGTMASSIRPLTSWITLAFCHRVWSRIEWFWLWIGIGNWSRHRLGWVETPAEALAIGPTALWILLTAFLLRIDVSSTVTVSVHPIA